MIIKNTKSISEYRKVREYRINKWIDERFVKGCVTWVMLNPTTIKVIDKTGDFMIVSLDEIY